MKSISEEILFSLGFCCCHFTDPHCRHIVELKSQLSKADFSGMMPDDYKYFSLLEDDAKFNLTFMANLYENLVERKMEHISRVLRNRLTFIDGIRDEDKREGIMMEAEKEMLKLEDFYKGLSHQEKIEFLLKTSWTYEEETRDTLVLIWVSSEQHDKYLSEYKGFGMLSQSLKSRYLKIRVDLEDAVTEMKGAYENYKKDVDKMLEELRGDNLLVDEGEEPASISSVLEEVKDLELGDDSPV